jgi:hypothetical protein
MAALLSWLTGGSQAQQMYTPASLRAAVAVCPDRPLVALGGKVYDVTPRPDMCVAAAAAAAAVVAASMTTFRTVTVASRRLDATSM